MNGISLGELIVDPVKDILLVPFGVEDDEFGRIQESAGIQPVGFEEVSPVFAAIAKVDASGRGAKCSIGGSDVAGWFRQALTRPRGGHDHQAGFSAVLRWRRAGYHLQRLN